MIESLYAFIMKYFGKPAPRMQNWAFPLIVVFLYLLSFAWALPSLGFYLDDWPHIYYQKFGGSEAINLFHAYDGRPLLGWFYFRVSEVLGFAPIYRQILALVLRFLTVIVVWRILQLIWPKLSWQVDTAALLFSVYPIFAQQPVSVAFSSHWAAFLCLMLSFYFMFLAIKYVKFSIVLTIVSILFAILHYSLSEYFLAVDFLRFMLIYYFGINNFDVKTTLREKIIWTFRHSFIYSMVCFGFVVWRMFLLKLPTADRIEPVILENLIKSPMVTLQQLLGWMVKDFFLNTVISWYKTFSIEIFDLQSRFSIFLLLIIFLVSFLCSIYLAWRNYQGGLNSNSWVYQGLIISFVFTILAPLPSWATGRSSSLFIGPMSDRFGLPAMFGASILAVAFVDFFVRTTSFRILFLALLVGLATSWQARNTNEFRWSWVFQQRFFHQLILRVPSIESNSLISSEQEFLPKVGGYPLSYALNTMYGRDGNTGILNYYYVNLSKEYDGRLEDFTKGEMIFRQRWQSKFIGYSTEGIVIDYRPEEGTCLWVLNESDSKNPLLPDITRNVLSASDLSRILVDSNNSMTNEIFGEPHVDTWCEFYQQAELAAQLKDWEKVIELWNSSEPYHRQINATTELEPFIEAYLHKGEVAKSFELSRKLNQGIRGGAIPYLCSIWERALSEIEQPLARKYIDDWDCDFLNRNE